MAVVIKELKDVPLMQFEIWNENNRFYPLDIYKKKIMTKRTQESMDNKMLLGEIDHPEERFNTNMDFVSHSIVSLRLDESNKMLYGDIDILDTPRGRVLKVLSDYGNVGFSARALGSGRKVKNGEIIDVNSYMFKTFDAVPNPGFSTSRAKNESIDDCSSVLHSLYESFNDVDKCVVHSLYESFGLIEKSEYKKNAELFIDSNSQSSTYTISDDASDGELDNTIINESSEDSRVYEMKINIDVLEESLTQATDKLEQYKRDYELLNEQFSIIKEALVGKSKINETLQSKISNLEEKNKKLLESYSSTKLKYDDLCLINESQKSIIKSLRRNNRSLLESIEEKNDLLESKDELLDSKEQTIRDLKISPIVETETNPTKKPSVRVVKTLDVNKKMDTLTAKLYENLNK